MNFSFISIVVSLRLMIMKWPSMVHLKLRISLNLMLPVYPLYYTVYNMYIMLIAAVSV